MVFCDFCCSLVVGILACYNFVSHVPLSHPQDRHMHVGIWKLLWAQWWARWSANASSICCRHVTHVSSPWERSVFILFTTLCSQGGNLALFQEQWLVLLYHRLLCSFMQFSSDFLRYPRNVSQNSFSVNWTWSEACDYCLVQIFFKWFLSNYEFSHYTAYNFSY